MVILAKISIFVSGSAKNEVCGVHDGCKKPGPQLLVVGMLANGYFTIILTMLKIVLLRRTQSQSSTELREVGIRIRFPALLSCSS